MELRKKKALTQKENKRGKSKKTYIWKRRKVADRYGKWTSGDEHRQTEPRLDDRREMQRDIIKNLTGNKIHIAAIQETQFTQDREYIQANYHISTAAAAKRKKLESRKEEQQ